MTQTLGFLLADEINVGKVGYIVNSVIKRLFCGICLEVFFKLKGVVKVILYDLLAPVGDDEDVGNSRRRGFLNKVLNRGLVTMFSISLGTAFDAGRTLVPRPAAGIIALVIFFIAISLSYANFTGVYLREN